MRFGVFLFTGYKAHLVLLVSVFIRYMLVGYDGVQQFWPSIG